MLIIVSRRDLMEGKGIGLWLLMGRRGEVDVYQYRYMYMEAGAVTSEIHQLAPVASGFFLFSFSSSFFFFFICSLA